MGVSDVATIHRLDAGPGRWVLLGLAAAACVAWTESLWDALVVLGLTAPIVVPPLFALLVRVRRVRRRTLSNHDVSASVAAVVGFKEAPRVVQRVPFEGSVSVAASFGRHTLLVVLPAGAAARSVASDPPWSAGAALRFVVGSRAGNGWGYLCCGLLWCTFGAMKYAGGLTPWAFAPVLFVLVPLAVFLPLGAPTSIALTSTGIELGTGSCMVSNAGRSPKRLRGARRVAWKDVVSVSRTVRTLRLSCVGGTEYTVTPAAVGLQPFGLLFAEREQFFAHLEFATSTGQQCSPSRGTS
jgi:hypothetical protein